MKLGTCKYIICIYIYIYIINDRITHLARIISTRMAGDILPCSHLSSPREDLVQVEVPLDDPGGLLGEVVPIVGMEKVPVGLAVPVVLAGLRRPVLVVVLAPLVPLDGLRQGAAPDPGAFQEEGLVVPHGDNDVAGPAAGRGSTSPRRRGVVIHTLILGVVGGGQRMDLGQDDVEQIPPRHPIALGLAVISGLLDRSHLMTEIGQDGLVVLVGLRGGARGRAGRRRRR